NGTVSGGNGVDDDGNGKVDDVIGWDFFSNDNNPYQAYNGNDHGSHVAGCVGAVTHNGVGVASVPQRVKLMITKHQSNTTPSTSVSYGNNGIYYCADSGAHIINCSWGGPGGSSTSNTTVNYAYNQGSLVLAAAGNDDADHATSPSYPSDATNAISVAASNSSDEKASFSDYGTAIDLTSPGDGILSTIYNNGANTYASFSGTSMATPVAAGIAAMVKATHPDYSVQQIRQRLLATADEIPQMYGTIYEGKLGSGRVNAFKAILSDIIPNLSLYGMNIVETQGDGDTVPNPGEVISASISLENTDSWLDATNINAVVRTQLNGVTIIDSVLSFSDIFNGFNGTSTNMFKFSTPADFNVYEIPFVLHITADSAPGSNVVYAKDINFTVSLSLIQSGWPINVGASSSSSPLLVDLKQDGQKVLVFGDTSGKVHALKADGTELSGFPVTVSENSNIMNGLAIANLIGDSKPEIVAAAMSSTVKIIDHNGQVQATANLEGNIRNCPVIADVTGDSQPEILIGTQSKKLYVLNGTDLSINSGFPLTLEAAIIANLAAEDMNNDNKKELIVPTNQKLHVINGTTGEELTGWPVALSSPSLHGPTVANFDNDENTNEIVIAGSSATNCPITIYSKDGVVMSNILNPAAVKSEVTAFKMDSDNRYEIAYTDYSGSLYVRDASLSPVENFPVQVTPSVECSPVVYSLVENGQDNILFGDNDGYLHAFNMQGNEIAGFPVKCGQSLKVSPAIGNFDTDNDVDIMLPNQNEIVFVDYKSQGFDGKWASFRGNSNRSASVFDSSVAGEDVIVTPAFNALEQNYPNPFNPTTSIAFSLKQNSPVKLTVYNIKGQVVKSLINEKMNAGSHSITWNGKDNQNKSVSSGIYFYKLESHDFTSTRKMMLIK
ncbi:MAG TPA: S8 family serine peptidase, partial [Candidatus Cloacimonadota bacterium]|nr:S8 family serine peptidase [Candidatus Cloacimonadota bacterium]